MMRSLAASLLVGIATAACIEPPAGLATTNDLDVPVVVSYATETETFRERLEAGEAKVLRFGLSDLADGTRCTVSDLVILNEDGQEIGRVPPPLCIDDGVWTSYWSKD
jgi:hypothetical protein